MTETPAEPALRTFAGATAVVTGGASGIGRALGEELAARGAEVVLADRQLEVAEEVVAALRAGGAEARAAELDVRDWPAVERLVHRTAERSGRLDYLFNNAGIVLGGGVRHYRIEDWNELLDVNLRGVVHGVQAAYPVMAGQGFGHIVNTASVAGLLPSPGHVAYAASKHAVVGLSTSLRAEVAAIGLRVSVVCPGFVRTPILDRGGRFGRMLFELTPEQERRAKVMLESFRPMAPRRFASEVLDRVARNRGVIVVPARWRVFWWLNSLLPTLSIAMTAGSFRRSMRKLGFDPPTWGPEGGPGSAPSGARRNRDAGVRQSQSGG